MAGRIRLARQAWARISLVMLVFAACLLLLVSSPAMASESSELSDDGRDYGPFYRRGDVLYDIQHPGEPILYYVDGKWYEQEGDAVSTSPSGVSEFYYPDGTLSVQAGAQVCLEAVLRHPTPQILNGEEYWLHDMQCYIQPGGAIGYGGSYPRLTYLKLADEHPALTKRDLRRIILDEDLGLALGDYDEPGRYLTHLDRWFEGCDSLEEIRGLENVPTGKVRSMARMFAGCSMIEELDLSGLDTSSCTDMGEMFEGCASLTTLTTGEGWTQEACRAALATGGDDEQSESEPAWSVVAWYDGILIPQPYLIAETPSGGAQTEGRLATFPVAMTSDSSGETVSYAKGDVIPDGAATYIIADRVRIRDVATTLTSDDGTSWTQGDASSRLTCKYTGEEVRPAVSLSYEGEQLVEGVDYTVSYRDNIESGTGEVILQGMGTYYGKAVIAFAIEDRAAYAFLYEDGLLYIKADHKPPRTSVVSSEKPLERFMRWFDKSDGEPGTEVPWADVALHVKRVVFDRSFFTFEPVSAEGWFAGCTQLTSVVGLPNIKGSSLASMASMFAGCDSLEEVDLTGLDTSSVCDVHDFAKGCDKLVRLTLDKADLSNVTDSSGYVADCPLLTEIVTASGWHNAIDESAQLRLPSMAFKTLPSFARMQPGSALTAAPATYRLRDLAMQLTNVEMASDTYTCTGKAIKPPMKVTLGNIGLVEGTDYTITYANNVYPGKAKATITGKGVFSGGLIVPYTIKARVTKVGDRLTVTNASGTYTLKVTKVSKNGLAAEATILKVQATSGSTLTLPSECTIGGVKVSVTGVSSKLSGNFRNVKTVIVGAKVTTIGASAFSKATKVTKLVLKTKKLKTVKNCLKGSKITSVQTKVTLSSSVKKKYKKWFTSKATVGKSVTYSYK